MCELFSVSLSRKKNISNDLEKFFGHCNKHPHGWGILREEDSHYIMNKESVKADESKALHNILQTIEEQKLTLAHIRLATVGNIKYENCHPFQGKDISGRTWTLIHNGTIYSSSDLMKYLSIQAGDTDSERIFLYLIESINKLYEVENQVTDLMRIQAVENVVKILSPRNKLNLMIFDGELLYIHKNMDGTLYQKEVEDGIMFATSPLNDGWIDFDMCTLKVYKNGEMIYVGDEETTEFVPTLEYITALAALNI